MNAYLKTTDATSEALLAAIVNLQRPKDSPRLRCWVEGPDGWSLDWWPGLDGTLDWRAAGRPPVRIGARDAVLQSQAGRLFARDGELRWRMIPALGDAPFRIVFLGTADWLGEDLEDQAETLRGLTPEAGVQFLWGQHTQAAPGEWIELRIPHRFRYPIDGGPRGVKVVTERWIDDLGEPHFVRLCDLIPLEETG